MNQSLSPIIYKYVANLFFIIFIFSCKNDIDKTTEISKPQNKQVKKLEVRNIKPYANLLALDGLKGKVKSMTKTTFHAQRKKGVITKVAMGNLYKTSYDSLGNGIERKYFNSESKLQTLTKYQIDKTRKSNQAIVFSPTKSIIKTLTFRYNKNQNLIEEIGYNSKNQILSKQIFQYNSKGELASEIKYGSNNKFDIKTTYTYDKSGFSMNTKFYQPENTMIIECKTTYSNIDQHGNWLKSIEQTNKGSLFIVERKIEYYK